MDGFLECPVCLDIASKAVESQCCNKIFCEQCVAQYTQGSCPLCRKTPFKTKQSVLARRMIDALPVECPYECGSQLTRGRLATHLEDCPKRVVKCSFPKCDFQGTAAIYLQHITKTHPDAVVRSFDFCNINQVTMQKEKQQNNDVDDEKKKDEDPIVTRRNSRGFRARLGETGKYYCGKAHAKKCSCCDGHCGPTNGCNCRSCMELDVKYRNLPKGYLVNKHGATARISDDTGSFYCGRKCDELGSRSDGYCGPTNGPNCAACRWLDRQALTRYKRLM